MASWNLNVGSLTPALGLSSVGVNVASVWSRYTTRDTAWAGGYLRKLGGMLCFEMLFIADEKMRLCGFLGGQRMNSWQKKRTNKRRVASR